MTSSLFASEIKFNKLTLEESIKQASQEGKMVFVNFTADWSDNSITANRDLFKSEDVIRLLTKKYVTVEANFTDGDSKAWFDSFNVFDLPTYVILNNNGAEVNRITGKLNLQELHSFINIGSNSTDMMESNKMESNTMENRVEEQVLLANAISDDTLGPVPSIDEELSEFIDVPVEVLQDDPEKVSQEHELIEGIEKIESEFIIIEGRPAIKAPDGTISYIVSRTEVPLEFLDSYDKLQDKDIAKELESGVEITDTEAPPVSAEAPPVSVKEKLEINTANGSLFTVVRKQSLYTIQVGAFSNEMNVVKLMDKINAAYPSANAYIVRDNDNSDVFKLCVGEFSSEGEAELGKSLYGTYSANGFVRSMY